MTEPPARGALEPAGEVQAMFGRIVRRYDLVNRLMTGGRDVAWRKLVARTAVAGGRRDVALDVATGTGDLAIVLAEAGAKKVIGVDFVPAMLSAAARKPGIADGADRVWLATADALRLPFPDGVFDACTVSFGLRNMADYEAAVREMTRVLRPGGRFVCLELTPYRVPVLRRLFGWYFRAVVPLVGGLLSGDRAAYRYLPASVATFPAADDLAALMRRAGLDNVRYRRLGGGTVAMHVGEKP
ncbi:MAG TPA: class I SAM-dependent methyltransferase [Thermomicrobiales bacterium]|nr:class I SAM-dependent methyltransferase [Thermomicrobiales bacterium]